MADAEDDSDSHLATQALLKIKRSPSVKLASHPATATSLKPETSRVNGATPRNMLEQELTDIGLPSVDSEASPQSLAVPSSPTREGDSRRDPPPAPAPLMKPPLLTGRAMQPAHSRNSEQTAKAISVMQQQQLHQARTWASQATAVQQNLYAAAAHLTNSYLRSSHSNPQVILPASFLPNPASGISVGVDMRSGVGAPTKSPVQACNGAQHALSVIPSQVHSADGKRVVLGMSLSSNADASAQRNFSSASPASEKLGPTPNTQNLSLHLPMLSKTADTFSSSKDKSRISSTSETPSASDGRIDATGEILQSKKRIRKLEPSANVKQPEQHMKTNALLSKQPLSTHSPPENMIREEQVQAALHSKPQRGKKRENLSESERLELTRTRNREHAKSTRIRKKKRYQELLGNEEKYKEFKRFNDLAEHRRESVVSFLNFRSEAVSNSNTSTESLDGCCLDVVLSKRPLAHVASLHETDEGNLRERKFSLEDVIEDTGLFTFWALSRGVSSFSSQETNKGFSEMRKHDRAIRAYVEAQHGKDSLHTLSFRATDAFEGVAISKSETAFTEFELTVDISGEKVVVLAGIIKIKFAPGSKKILSVGWCNTFDPIGDAGSIGSHGSSSSSSSSLGCQTSYPSVVSLDQPSGESGGKTATRQLSAVGSPQLKEGPQESSRPDISGIAAGDRAMFEGWEWPRNAHPKDSGNSETT